MCSAKCFANSSRQLYFIPLGQITKRLFTFPLSNKIESPFVIFYGEDEIKKSEVKLRNLKTGNESSIKIENLADEIKKII